MKKLLLILLIASGAWAADGINDTATTNGKWHAATQTTWSGSVEPTSIDTAIHKSGINDTADINYSLAAFKALGSGTWWWSGRTTHIGKFLTDSSTGTGHYGTALYLDGDGTSCTWTISSLVGARTVVSLAIYFTAPTGVYNNYTNSWLCGSLNQSASTKWTSNNRFLNLNGSTTFNLTMGDNAKLTFNSPGILVINTWAANKLIASLGVNDTFAGTGQLFFQSGIGRDTVPSILYIGSGTVNYQDRDNGGGIVLKGAQNLGTAAVSITNTNNIANWVFNANGQDFKCGALQSGCKQATKCDTILWGSGHWSFTSYSGAAANYNTGLTIDSLKSSFDTCSGSWTNGSNHFIYPGTSTTIFTGAGTTTNSNKSFGSVIINAAGATRTMSGKFRCLGNFTATAGSIIFGSLARDSIVGDYANNLTGTDTLNRNGDSLQLGGSWTGNLRVKNDLACTYLYGTSLCNLTSNGVTANCFDIRGDTRAKQQKLIDRFHVRKQVVTTGTLNTNGMDFFADSFLTCNDSIATVLGDTVSSRKITFGVSAKPMNGTPLLLYFGLALADTMRDSLPTTTSLGKLVVNKTGSNLTFANAGKYDTIQVINGSIAMNAATDTQYCKGLSITSTSTCVLIAPIVVTDSIYIAAGATVTYSGVGKIIKLTCSAAQGGNAVRIYYPTIAPVSYAASPWIDTVGKTATHAITITGCSLGKDSITNITALPVGYSISKTTGLISWDGTGTTMAAGNYVIRAYGNAKTDSASVTVSITINPALPIISYVTPGIDTVGLAAGPEHVGWAVNSTGGAVDSYALTSGTLVPAMTLNASTGLISGIPASAKAATVYRITATNITGSSYFDWAESVVPAPVIPRRSVDKNDEGFGFGFNF